MSGNALQKSLTDTLPTKTSHRLKGHRGSVASVAFHPFNDILVSGAEDGLIKLWDLESGDCLQSLKGHFKCVNEVCWSSDGKLLGNFSTLKRIATGSSDATIKLWRDECASSQMECIKTLMGHDDTISSLIFSKDSNFLYSASKDQTVRVWDLRAGFSVATLEHTDWVRSLDLSGDSILATACNHVRLSIMPHSTQNVLVWDLQDSDIQAELRGHSHVVDCVAFLPTGIKIKEQKEESLNTHSSYLVSGSRDKTIILWNWTHQQALRTLTGHDNWIRDLCFYNKYLVTVSEDKTARVWDLELDQVIKVYRDLHLKYLSCVHSSKRKLAIGSVDESISILSL